MMRKTTIRTKVAVTMGVVLLVAPMVPTGGAFAPPQTFSETTCFLEANATGGVTCAVVNAGGVPGLLACSDNGEDIPCSLLSVDELCQAHFDQHEKDACGGGNVWLGKYWDRTRFRGNSISFYGESGPCLPGIGYWVQDLSDYDRGWSGDWNNDISSAKSYENCAATLYSLDSCRSSSHVTIHRDGQQSSLPGLDDMTTSICWHD